MTHTLTVAGQLGAWAAGVDPASLPPEVRATCHRLLLDVTGLCVAARDTDYVAAMLASAEGSGSATAIGHRAVLTSYDAALVNGTAPGDPADAADGATAERSATGVTAEGPMIVREKTHPATPMNLDQALYEMELVGHDFYLFVEESTRKPSVVYRRRGYDYGVISLDLENPA